MATSTVRLDEDSRQILRNMAQRTGQPMSVLLRQAIAARERQLFLEEAAAAYAALRRDEAAWQDLEAERAEWDATLHDGMEDE